MASSAILCSSQTSRQCRGAGCPLELSESAPTQRPPDSLTAVKTSAAPSHHHRGARAARYALGSEKELDEAREHLPPPSRSAERTEVQVFVTTGAPESPWNNSVSHTTAYTGQRPGFAVAIPFAVDSYTCAQMSGVHLRVSYRRSGGFVDLRSLRAHAGQHPTPSDHAHHIRGAARPLSAAASPARRNLRRGNPGLLATSVGILPIAAVVAIVAGIAFDIATRRTTWGLAPRHRLVRAVHQRDRHSCQDDPVQRLSAGRALVFLAALMLMNQMGAGNGTPASTTRSSVSLRSSSMGRPSVAGAAASWGRQWAPCSFPSST